MPPSSDPVRHPWPQRLGSWLRAANPKGRPPPPLHDLPRPPAGLLPTPEDAAHAGPVWYRALFDHAGEGLLVCTDDGVLIDANPMVATLLDAAPGSLRGRSLGDLLLQGGLPVRAPATLSAGDAVLRGPVGDRPVDLHAQPVVLPGGRRWLLRLRDLGDRQQVQAQLAYLSHYDSLTGLPNRALFRDRLAQAMGRARRSQQPLALMFIDLDRFKLVNDSLGHDVGDRLLQHVARSLTRCLREVDSVARMVDDGEPFTLSRLGGDEFTVILEGVGSAEDAGLVARRILDALGTPFAVGSEELVASGSIGISLYPTDDVDLDTLVRHTDMAMYRSKSLGRGTYSFFSDDLNAAVSARLSLEGSLRHALERQEFRLHYQPKADLQTGQITGVEALLRWHRPGHGVVSPDRFISVLEDTGMILPVGAWVIRTACAQLAAWDQQGLPPLRMAVNLSARQFRHLHLARLVEDSLREHGISPRRLEIELTESLLMEDSEATRNLLAGFARMGVRLAIDDFGTGHSSLSYLKRLNIDTLKIDRSFVQSLPHDAEDVAIATAVIAMGRSLQLNLVAEGVETPQQAELLRCLGCHEMQGWLLGRAMTPEDFVAFLEPRLSEAREQTRAFGRRGLAPRPLSLAGLEDVA